MTRAQADFMDAVGGKDNPSVELPAATFAAYLGDTITGDVNSPSRNAIPATAQTALVFGAGASVQEGVLTTNGTPTGYIRSDWINGSDINQNAEYPTTTIDAGYGSNDSSLVVQSISGEDDLNYYATLTTSTDPIDTRALILTAYDKSTPAGVAVRLPNGLGLKGVHGWSWRITPSLKRVSITHGETNQTTTVNLPTFSWSGRVCVAQGHAYRGLQGVSPNRTYRGAEKFRVSQSLGYVGVAQHATAQETKDAISIITGTYVHPKVSLSPTSLTLNAGATPATFTATVENSTKGLVWTLTGPGSIPANSTGTTVVYTPPASLAAASSARLEATLIDGRAFDGTTITLQASSTPVVVPSSGRALFEVNESFTRASLSGDELAYYDTSWAWIEDTYDNFVKKLEDGKNIAFGEVAGMPENYPGGVIHMYHMRYMQFYSHGLLMMLYLYGDPKALTKLLSTWPKVIARTATSYTRTVGSDEKKREQVGIKRWIYFNNVVGQNIALDKGGDTDELHMEKDLTSGPLAQVELAFKQNITHGAGTYYPTFSSFVTDHYAKRYAYLSAQVYGSTAPYHKWGKALRHPSESRFCWHLFRFLTHGKAEDKVAYEAYGVWLYEDRELVTIGNGKRLMLHAHGVLGKATQLGSPAHRSLQDATYLRESNPHMLLSYWAGSPYHTKEHLAGFGHTMHECVLPDGPKSDYAAATITGQAAASYQDKKIFSPRDGLIYPLSRFEAERPSGRELIQQAQRGHTFVLSHLTGDAAYIQELKDLNAETDQIGRKAAAFGLLLYVATRRGGGVILTPIAVPKLSLSPTSLTVKVADPSVTFTATAQSTTEKPLWNLEPSHLGTLTVATNGLSAVYKPPTEPGVTGTAAVLVYLASNANVKDNTNVVVTESAGDGSTSGGGTGTGEEVLKPALARADIYRMDLSFRSSSLGDHERGYYESGFANLKRTLSSGSTPTASRYQHNDVTANGHARTNSTQYSQAVPIFFETGDPAFVDWVFDRLELIRNGMINVNTGDRIPYHADGKSSQRRAIENESYFATAKTIPNDNGTTFSTSWKAWPKFIYIHHQQPLIKTDGVEHADNASSGTDLHTHDLLPRYGSTLELCLIGDRNTDRPRAAGKMGAKALMDWWYDWFYKDFAFRRWRADNSSHVPSGFRQGKTVTVEGYGKYIDWNKDISHDVVQQNQVDANMWEWSRLREGATSVRARFWEEVFRTRAKLIFDSMAFWENAPNGKTTVGFGHKMSAILFYAKRTSSATKRAFTKIQAYTTGAWLVRYCDDMYPALACMTYKGMPYYADGRFAKAAANNFTQIGWHSDKKLTAGMCGLDNKFIGGTPHAYPSYWPKNADGTPCKLNSRSDYFYELGTSRDPVGESNTAASVEQRFEEAQGYEILAFDPTADLQNFKRGLEVVNFPLSGSAKYTLVKGKTQTTLGSNVFVKMQIISFLLAHRTGKELTAI